LPLTGTETVSIAAALAADLGSAVGAGVEQRAHDPVLAAHEDDAARAELAHAEVARLGDLGLVAEVDPRAVEDALKGVVYVDDAQIVSELLDKRWGEPARVEVVIIDYRR